MSDPTAGRSISPTDRWVIYDPINQGYAVDNPIEGWIFTIEFTSATRFDTEEAARRAVRAHYRGDRRLLVKPTVT